MRLPIFLAAVLASVQGYFECPTGYTSNSINITGVLTHYCYKVYLNGFTRQQARSQCLQDGANLATIDSLEENQMYRTTTTVSSFLWIGLSCMDNNNCAFDDGTSYSPAKYNAFVGGLPNTENGYCTYLQTAGDQAGKWGSIDCDTLLGGFVCHYNPNSATSQQSGCNSYYVLDEVPLVITSPNYPQKYADLMTCSYYVKGNASPAYGINITFTDFYTGDTYLDVVRVYNGGYMHNATLLGVYSGKMSPFTVLTSDYESLITFTADGASPVKGFSAIVSNYKK